MDLAKLDSKMPVKAIPEQQLNQIIIAQFVPWICGLLSLTNETSAERLELALPAIKLHCWSMGFDEIKKMFELYADNKLSIEPIPNYFDRILFGKIVEAYKQQKPMKKPEIPKPKKEDILVTMFINMLHYWDEYQKTNRVSEGGETVFERLVEKEIIARPDNPKYKSYYSKKMLLAKEYLEKIYSKPTLEKREEYKSILKQIQSGLSPRIECKAKCLVLEDYFNKLVSNEIDFKEVLREKWDIKIIENSKNNPL